MAKKPKRRGRPPLPAHRKKGRSITFKVPLAMAEKLERASSAHALSLSEEILSRLDPGESELAWELAYDLIAVIKLAGAWDEGADALKQNERERGWKIEAHEARKNPAKFGEPIELETARTRYGSGGSQVEKIRAA